MLTMLRCKCIHAAAGCALLALFNWLRFLICGERKSECRGGSHCRCLPLITLPVCDRVAHMYARTQPLARWQEGPAQPAWQLPNAQGRQVVWCARIYACMWCVWYVCALRFLVLGLGEWQVLPPTSLHSLHLPPSSCPVCTTRSCCHCHERHVLRFTHLDPPTTRSNKVDPCRAVSCRV